MEKKETGTRITVTYCQEFHRIAWEQACKVNPDNPMAVAESISDLVEALKECLNFFTVAKAYIPAHGNTLKLVNNALAKVEGK